MMKANPHHDATAEVEPDSLEELFGFYQMLIDACAGRLVVAAETLQICRGHMPAEVLEGAEISPRAYVDEIIEQTAHVALMAKNIGLDEPSGSLDLTIKKAPFDSIIDGSKKVEFREVKEYYFKRLAAYFDWELGEIGPFRMRLRNGYASGVPEITVQVEKVTVGQGLFELHLGEILEHKNLKPDQEHALRMRAVRR